LIIFKADFCYYCSPVYHTTRLFQFFFQHIQHCILQLINIVVNLFAVYFIRMLLLERIFSTKSVIFRNPVCALMLRTSPEADQIRVLLSRFPALRVLIKRLLSSHIGLIRLFKTVEFVFTCDFYNTVQIVSKDPLMLIQLLCLTFEQYLQTVSFIPK
jgi:hypothetical protein